MHPERKTGRRLGPTLRATVSSLPVAATLGLSGALAFLSGGYILGRSTPAAVAYLAVAVVLVWLVREWSRPSPLFACALVSLAAFALWSGLSITWSFGPDLTWNAFNVSTLYLAVLAVVGLSPVRAFQLRVAAWAFLAAAVAVAVYGFLGKALPDVVTHAHRWARLSEPIGYWNGLALFVIMGLVVTLALAADTSTRLPRRVVAAAAAVPMAFTFWYSYSRGGWIVLGVALGVYFLMTTTRLASFGTLVAVSAPVAYVLWRLRGLETLSVETTDGALRAAQGGALLRWSLVALLVTIGSQTALVILQKRVRWPRWMVVTAGIVVVVVLVVGGSIGSTQFLSGHGGTTWVKHKVRELATDTGATPTTRGAGRLTTTSTGRPPLWREALEQSAHNRVVGTGAGTFPFTHYRFRPGWGVVKHSHSQWMNVLSELGVVGLALYAAVVIFVLAAALGDPLARRRDPLHPLLAAMLAAGFAFFVHISWDWQWDMAAVGVAAFALLAAASAYRLTRSADERAQASSSAAPDDGSAVETPRPVRSTTGWPPRVVVTVAVVLLAVSWLPPYLSDRAQNRAIIASSDGKTEVALRDAQRASGLNPLAVEPLITEALILLQLGRSQEALALLRQATGLQPDNYRGWYQLGLLQANTLGRKAAARKSFRRALGLNPYDRGSFDELLRLGS